MNGQCQLCLKNCEGKQKSEKPCNMCIYNNKKHWLKECIECFNQCKFTQKTTKPAKQKKQRKKQCQLCHEWHDNLEEHHLLLGKNREKADKHGLTINICWKCHKRVHATALVNILRKVGQLIFEKKHSRKQFIKEFGKSYIDEGENQEALEILSKLENNQPIIKWEERV